MEKYLLGIGVDVSKKHFVRKAKHAFIPINNFYSLKEVAKPETLDYVYSKGIVNLTKFHRLLIKEWFYAIKLGGKIIIEMRPNHLLGFKQMVGEVELLLNGKIKIIENKFDKESWSGKLIFEKNKLALEKTDEMEKWTFGILTNGKRDNLVDKTIKSIIDLKIPKFEVLICGEYSNKPKYKIKNLNFNTEIPWITKKKNLICEKAKYENIIVMHDRYIFNENWYKGMKKYGNYFEVLSCVVTDDFGNRTDEWLTYGTDLNDPLLVGNHGKLEYYDWDKNIYIDGGLYILKKAVNNKVKWDNALLWGQAEDILLAREFYNRGIVTRFNPFSSCKTTVLKQKWPLFKFNEKKLGKMIGQYWFNKVKYILKRDILKKHYFALKDCYYILKKYYKK